MRPVRALRLCKAGQRGPVLPPCTAGPWLLADSSGSPGAAALRPRSAAPVTAAHLEPGRSLGPAGSQTPGPRFTPPAAETARAEPDKKWRRGSTWLCRCPGSRQHVEGSGLGCEDGGGEGACAFPPPSQLQGSACLQLALRPTQSPKLAPRGDPTPSRPARPAPGWHSQVCEIIQGLVRSEHVQQPDHLGRRPERQARWGPPARLAGRSGQESPLQLSSSSPTAHSTGSAPGSTTGPGTPAPDAGYFWPLTAGILWGKGSPKSGSAPSSPRSSSSLALPPSLPVFLSPLKTWDQGGDSLPGDSRHPAGTSQGWARRERPGGQHCDQPDGQA